MALPGQFSAHTLSGDAGLASRPLAGLERAMRYTDDVVPFNVVVVLQLEGKLAPSAVRSALDALQRRHPLLRARLHSEGKRHFFEFDAAGPIPLDVRERRSVDGWIADAEEELGRHLDLAAGPLMRCRYLAGESGGDLLLTFQHVIVDATSVVRLIRELLSYCAGGLPPGDGISGEGRVPASALFPPEYSGPRFARAVAAFMGRQVADEIGFRWHSRGVRKPPIAESGNCRILAIALPAALSSALIQASRHRRITLNSILGAALLTAVQRGLYPSPRVPLRHLVFADLRPRLRQGVPDDMLGCFLTMVRFTVLVERDGGFWSLAQRVQEAIVRAERSGERFLAYRLSPGVIKVVLGQRSFRWSATAFSYSGPPDLPVRYGALELTGLHAFPSNWTTGPEYSALARLFRGQICFDILYLDCDMEAGTARELARDLEHILREATC